MNPILSVTPSTGGSAVTDLPAPSKYKYGLFDLSGSSAGRTEDGAMQKKRKGQSITIELEWRAVSLADGAAILQAYNPEYVVVEYLDAKAGGYLTKTFYVGDRNAPLFDGLSDVWDSISFTIIQQDTDQG